MRQSKGKNRIGETRMQKCGITATIIAYRTCDDIDIEFTNGIVVTNRKYANFKNGQISPHSCSGKAYRIGEQVVMKCGMCAEIIEYRNACDIDVRFEDGTVVQHKTYSGFKAANIANPRLSQEQTRIGETRTMHCGLKATIIAYRSCKDIDVQFEDGIIVCNKYYTAFLKGKIGNPAYTEKMKLRHVGETKTMNCGLKATIVAWRKWDDIDVQFANGEIVCGRNYKDFKESGIGIKINHVGEKREIDSGFRATIIEYRNCNDIDIEFNNGVVLKHKRYSQFLKGEFKDAAIRVGEKRHMNCGEEAVIIEYRSASNIDIQFVDSGEIIKNRAYRDFVVGTIRPRTSHLNKPVMMKNGLSAEIIADRACYDCDYQFEDGVIVKGPRSALAKKMLKHPNLYNNGKCLYHGFEAIVAWREESAVYYKCRCLNCMDKQAIMTPQEMLKHKCDKEDNNGRT